MTEENFKSIEQALEKHIKIASQLRKHLRALTILMNREDAPPEELTKALTSIKKIMDKSEPHAWNQLFDELRACINQAEKAMPQRLTRWRMTWLGEAESALKKIERPVRIEQGVLIVPPLKIYPPSEKMIVRIYYGPDEIARIPSSINRLVSWLKKWFQDIQKVLTPPEQFIHQLWDAYRRALNANEEGQRVPLWNIYRELVVLRQSKAFWTDATQQRFHAYPRYAFSLDLARLREHREVWEEKFDIRLVTATFDATRRKGDYVWIPERGGTHGYRYAWIIIHPKTPAT